MGRKCSHCGFVGHNSRTCASIQRDASFSGGGGRVMLFGVQLEAAYPCGAASRLALKKSSSMDCLMPYTCVLTSSSSPSSSAATDSSLSLRAACDAGGRLLQDEGRNRAASNTSNDGYVSDGFLGRAQERKKGVPWTEEEHRTFLMGLETLGKGDWRGISRKFVRTRTPTQVASHAQKYFLRRNSLHKRNKRRPSLFDVGQERCSAHHHGQIPKPSESFTPMRPFSPQSGSTGRDSRTRMALLTSPRTCSSDHELLSSNPVNPASTTSGCQGSKPNLELTLASPNHQLDQGSSISVT
ncbi:transcription factor MYBS3-like isoform X2 [Rhodamnia argentea]|uniref:Transcription factor MYBS3-like isoform X2 n=1 Tax=Rhodamnia argentea TaxID=178133 RepID=A0A8B8QZC4_9MYRT|nr:transcription factor MYBS3-like isoform X2 [Rhodamnia argentea]